MSERALSGLVWLGDSAASFSRPEGISPAAISLWTRAQEGVLDVVISEQQVAVYFDPRHPPPQLQQFPLQCAQLDSKPPVSRTHRISVIYDGDDLPAVAEATGLDVATVIRAHSEGCYQVAMLGFLPGFGYLQGLDSRLVIPRRPQPRARVAANSVAIAGVYSAIYPCASPGGWNLLGTAVGPALFNEDGARFALGDAVVFEPVR